MFISSFKQRFIYCMTHNWYDELLNSSKCTTYCTLKLLCMLLKAIYVST